MHGRISSEHHTGTLLFLMATLLVAIIVDYLARWPFIMTPLYAVPVLIAAHRLSPRAVGATAVLVTVVNLASGLIQGTPFEVVLLYTSGLVMVAYLAVSLAWQMLLANLERAPCCAFRVVLSQKIVRRPS